ncbi:predicted protein [Nematostella vectensis]|uniref:JmjC domain-containing protein n=1 Tax=Nematostella vectensis TaxID=45351 RepID=A7SFI3_NEMVE|nr:predicted protein [Nematostella vectensis]|eukprot:XP_001629567.1 predicted protein [Nematostella vectensis]
MRTALVFSSVTLLFVACVADKIFEIRGHGLELGKHRDSDGHVEVLQSLPSPKEFWDNYASIRKPVVLRGAGKNFPAFDLWTDPYLVENYGDLEVKLEARKEKEKVPVGEKGLGRDTIRSFLESYAKKDTYMVSQLPDPLAREVRVLPCLMCGTFSERILEANLWLSSGGTKSMLHKDADNAINCLLNGTKDWILIHPDNEKNIPVAKGDKGYGGFATLDVDKVNLIKYPKFKEVHWQYANLTAGDCLYLPYSYWHQVRSYGAKNMAVSVLFSRLTQFNETGCESAKLEYTPLSDVNMVWTYPGHGPQTMGNLDPFELKDNYLQEIKHIENQQFTVDYLFESLTQEGVYENHPSIRRDMASKILSIMDPGSKGYAGEDDIEALTVESLKAIADILDPDAANTEEYEHITISVDDVRGCFQEALKEGDGQLTLNSLIEHYKELEGSEKVARELFAMLEPKQKYIATQEEVDKHLPEILELFKKVRVSNDMSGEWHQKEVLEDKKIMEEYLKTVGQNPDAGNGKARDEL